VRVTAVQLQVDDTGPAERRAAALAQVDAVAAAGADLVMLPEMWLPGYFGFDAYDALAEPLDGPLVEDFRVLARRHDVALLVGSIVERSDRGLHNTSVLLGRDGGTVASYRKVHLFPYGSREHEVLTRGEDVVVADLDGVRVGLSTCYDLRFPELYRAMVDEGAELFLVVAGWPVPRLDAWRTLGRSRAIENQAALVACNSAGRQAGSMYLGASYAFDAWGTPLGQLDDRPGNLRVDIDPEAIRAARAEFPALRGRVIGVEPPPGTGPG
jgi:predicted amidohydrolase